MFAKRIIFVSDSQADVYWWEDKSLHGPVELLLNKNGIEKLDRHLCGLPEMMTYLIVDVVEEEFRVENIPHLSGKEKKDFIIRKLEKFYPTSAYRGVLGLGREKTGRRDDGVLFAALTNPNVFKPWIDCLLKHKVPIGGVYTPSSLGGKLLQVWGVERENILFITQQKNSGVRQTFFHKKKLKLSRLISVSNIDAKSYVDFIFSEIEQTRLYLNRSGLLDLNSILDVCFVGDGVVVEEILKINENFKLIKVHACSVENIESGFVVARPAECARYCDRLFVRALLSYKPLLNYIAPGSAKYKLFREIRLSMYVASLLFLVVSFIWGGMNVIEGSLLNVFGKEVRVSGEFVDREYEKITANIPETPVSPEGLKQGVEIAALLKNYKVTPEAVLKMISVGLNESIELRVEKIQWTVTRDAPVLTGSGSRSKLIEREKQTENNNIQMLYQVVLIHGRFDNFLGEYRKMFVAIENMEMALKKQPAVVDVEAIKLPLDVDSKSSLKGQAGVAEGAGKARFVLRVVLKTSLSQDFSG